MVRPAATSGAFKPSKMALYCGTINHDNKTEPIAMPLTPEITEELNVLTHFRSATMLDGIKVHHSAGDDMVAATRRLFDKGLVTQQDGGYLTNLGREVVEHLDAVLRIVNSKHEFPNVS